MVVKKKNGKDLVCIDFTNLKKACSKDSFPLPKIDQLVDATTGYPRMSFLNAYLGNNQIPMKKEDRIHTDFTIENAYSIIKSCRVGLNICWRHVSKIDEQDVCCATW